MLKEWGTYLSWTRAVVSARPLYGTLSASWRCLSVHPRSWFCTITLLHLGVLPLLVERRHDPRGRGVAQIDP